MKFEVGSMKSEVGANNAGEFMRRYSPLMRRGKSPTIDRRRRGESCRRIYAPTIDRRRRGESCRRIHAPLFALDNDNPTRTPPH